MPTLNIEMPRLTHKNKRDKNAEGTAIEAIPSLHKGNHLVGTIACHWRTCTNPSRDCKLLKWG